jgi:uncharacterized protein YkwD/LysM repeat protein
LIQCRHRINADEDIPDEVELVCIGGGLSRSEQILLSRIMVAYMYLRITRRASVLLLLFLLSAPLMDTRAWASPAAAPSMAPTTELSPDARKAALIINQLRIQAGLAPLAVHPLLNLAVTTHIHDMVTTGYYGHTSRDGSNVHQRINRTGYGIAGWAGENWAVSDTVEQSIQWWMTDPPHRDNVLGRGYKEMGVGVYPHPKGWGLILVTNFTTGSNNQESGIVLVPETADAPMPSVVVAAPAAAPAAVPAGGMRYTIRQGDTLFTIGQRHGLSWQAVANANGLKEFSVLSLGQEIVIPGGGGTQQTTTAPAVTQSAPLSQGPGAVTVNDKLHTVVAGDTVFAIAIQHGLNWQTLAAYNGLSNNALLQIGDTIRIPAPAIGESNSVTVPSTRRHTVQAGETLWRIAAAYNVDWYELMRVNGLGENSVLSIGQEIRLP